MGLPVIENDVVKKSTTDFLLVQAGNTSDAADADIPPMPKMQQESSTPDALAIMLPLSNTLSVAALISTNAFDCLLLFGSRLCDAVVSAELMPTVGDATNMIARAAGAAIYSLHSGATFLLKLLPSSQLLVETGSHLARQGVAHGASELGALLGGVIGGGTFQIANRAGGRVGLYLARAAGAIVGRAAALVAWSRA